MENFITLKELAKQIESIINLNFNNTYWVLLEIQKLNLYRTGHAYPELVEKDEKTNKIVAQMRGIIWANDYLYIQRKFIQVLGSEMKDGIRVLAKCIVNFHPVYGLSLRIMDIDTTYSQGLLEQERLLTIKKLQQQGLLDANKQIPFPLVPQRIAIISIETSKGFSDFVGVLANNEHCYSYKYTLFPAVLQGEKAVETITEQLKIINLKKDFYDIVVIVRGGGGEIGLSAYNDYSLAKAIATFPLPVLTGIGHSTNLTVCDMVAHYSAITPTDLGYYIIDKTLEFENMLLNIGDKLINTIKQKQNNYKEKINNTRFLLLRNITSQLYAYQSNLDKTINTFTQLTNAKINKSSITLIQIINTIKYQFISALEKTNNLLKNYNFSLKTNSKNIINIENCKLDNIPLILRHKSKSHLNYNLLRLKQINKLIPINLKQNLSDIKISLNKAQQIIDLSSPNHILKMGYVMLKKDNIIVTENNINKNDTIVLEGYKNQMEAEIINIEKK
ncbi:MAG: exodeoxyribonuclease VII large subunit [Bacteroidales bacterium]|jgi:exodeoxyribonuclease VII large subunit|nr:exodeoxyribonuclease VII large subunit [Bacteroidales bacterium]MDI9575045.1 exodeoxyribonuclease VII large subunit [Bacteroidota bacterium]MDD3755750.1 exodeoxyribonuclease VII large subunit [Bacteroidales bacterium]MDY0401166.1 exodeoxyribonuclease VII large subunit [Bacteroidales bacterium]HHW59632.1 exodeoxyribonuclease VII large subunit [Bacteroidales bacterium]